ncbi:SpaH/EbpB family LPXTG-anchored major pilin [Bifidobacterium boum]|uniref:SpaH/EbpB family LPXTG-anchored major pilin n=1 Tax=Bifidobacterium boum TaxID=78343 RepID=UPI003F8D9D88
MNKVLKGLVAVAATAAMAIAGFAGASTAMAEPTTHTVTITPAKDGHTYEAYQIFTGNLGADDSLGNVEWGSGVDSAKLKSTTDTRLKGKSAAEVSAVLATKGDKTQDAMDYARAFSKVLSNVYKNSSAFNATGSGSYTISGLEDGYYLIQDKAGSQDGKPDAYTSFILKIIGKDVTVAPKSTQPTVDKKVQDEPTDAEDGAIDGWGDTADHSINESFKFKLDATIPMDPSLADYNTYKVKFNDTMSKGVTFESIETVKVKGKAGADDKTWTLNPTTDYTATTPQAAEDGTQSWSLTIDDVIAKCKDISIDQGFTVEVNYNAHLNEKATVNEVKGTTDNKNSVNLEYSNNPNAQGLGKTKDKTVYVFTFAIKNKKVIDNEDGQPLEGAGFRLYTDPSCTPDSEYKLVKDANLNAYRKAGDGEQAVEMKSTTDGTFPIKGLDAGTYYLKETTTPKGYTTAEVKTITIKATHSIVNGQPNVVLSQDSTLDNKIVDKKGNILPSTGGMGTTILYAAGAAIVLVAVFGIAFAVRRRNAR